MRFQRGVGAITDASVFTGAFWCFVRAERLISSLVDGAVVEAAGRAFLFVLHLQSRKSPDQRPREFARVVPSNSVDVAATPADLLPR